MIRSVNVGGTKWAVRVVDDPAIEAIKQGIKGVQPDEYLDGILLTKQKQIVLRKGQSDTDRVSTLFHELVHAALPDLSEKNVSLLEKRLAPALYALGLRSTRAKRHLEPLD